MKTEEDEAFDDLARKQGMWGGGFKAKQAMAADKLQELDEALTLEALKYAASMGYGRIARENSAPFTIKEASAQQAQEPHMRYCPDCGSIGPVPATARDCCPDGQHARMVPENFAKSCRATFMRAIGEAKPVQDQDWKTMPPKDAPLVQWVKEQTAPPLPVQEPVACVQDLDEVKRKHLVYEKGMDWKDPLYTAPTPREWVGLTYEDWKKIEDMPDTFDQGVAWAQAKLKEKNT